MEILVNTQMQKLKIRRAGLPSVRMTFSDVADPMFEFNMAANGIPRGLAQHIKKAVAQQMVGEAFGKAVH